MRRPVACLAGALLAFGPSSTAAQHYRVRIDAQAQAVSFRGLVADSIAAGLVVPATTGGLQTPDGHAVRCNAGPFCYFMRPGPVVRGIPVTSSATAVLWGLGLEGLSLHATGRLVTDVGRERPWPGTEPSAQFIEGYLEYRRAPVIARAGRQLVFSRLEPIGFDGGWVRARWDRASLEFTGYAGSGLGQAAAVSVLSPALNPLDEWRPRDRQIVAGAEAAWLHPSVDLHAEYRREVDPRDRYFVSERTAVSFAARFAELRATGGFDYNIAEAQPGTADLAVTYLRPRFSVTTGARRYRPYFSLWTLWGAFNPVGYDAWRASAEVRATRTLTLHARGERYRYEDAEVSTGLVPGLEDRGWRVGVGAVARFGTRWSVRSEFSLERGPGASGRFTDATVSFTPGTHLALDVYGGTL
jgi:hypothetical protein